LIIEFIKLTLYFLYVFFDTIWVVMNTKLARKCVCTSKDKIF
jgi:hypothetical protein